jgi:Trk-type K+ transport system membrane component
VVSEDDKINVVNKGAQWLLGQPFNNVLLVAILCAISWLGYYGVTTAIPMHLQQIQAGYERLEDSHREERTHMLETYRDLIEVAKDRKQAAVEE